MRIIESREARDILEAFELINLNIIKSRDNIIEFERIRSSFFKYDFKKLQLIASNDETMFTQKDLQYIKQQKRILDLI